jgi:UDP-N-acetylmuramoylalanine--D-glutamate ligase
MSVESPVTSLTRDSDWTGLRVGVLGIGIAGFSCADALMQLGASVSIIDSQNAEKQQERSGILGSLGAQVFLGVAELPDQRLDLIITSPGLEPHHIFHDQAFQRGIPVWGELELAWRLRSRSNAAQWLCITGTNGKTTTTLMLESMLRASGYRTVAAGNIGNSLVDVVMHDELDAIAIEVGAPQLPFVHSMSPFASVCLNLAPDHVDHFAGFDAYAETKARIYTNTQCAAIYNDADPRTIEMVENADVIEGARAIGFTLGIPGLSMLGVVDGALVDRAFIPNRRDAAQELALVSDIHPSAAHNTQNALAAAGLARAFGTSREEPGASASVDAGGVTPSAIRTGLQEFEPAGHRIALVRELDGVVYVDDSKATNAHAAETSLMNYSSVIWIAGGLAKGQNFDDLVRQTGDRIKAAILMGTDAPLIEEALTRHASNVPIITLATRETSAMRQAVEIAQARAMPGDTVLLAPGCASWDMFTDYAHRGDAFCQAVASLESATLGGGN